ncbi:MAG TPA: hypothetical protein VNI36_12005 [Candidatus Dormibacteraeota bacterium]|nr:hypothetical protein [Candidatus Dormibacteraeota bacterium]
MRLRMSSAAALLLFACCCVPARAQSHAVSLQWNPSTDAGVNYNLYRLTGACPASGTAGFSKITAAPITGTAYTDSGVAPGAYCYYATSVLNGAESVPSNFAAAVILPAAPTGLSTAGTK